MWVPGTAARRLPVIAGMLDAARASGDDDLVAEAHLLRAAALLELGDPEGREALLSYITLAGNLGHARGRWAALTRQATFAQLAGRAEESARLGEQALELGLAIGEPDAVGCFCTSRAALTALGVSGPPIELDASDPLWPMLPVFRAWPFAARGETAAAAAALGDFSVLDITTWTGLEALAAAAVVFAAASGCPTPRAWPTSRPWSGPAAPTCTSSPWSGTTSPGWVPTRCSTGRPRRRTRRGWTAWPRISRTPRPRGATGEPRRCAPNVTR